MRSLDSVPKITLWRDCFFFDLSEAEIAQLCNADFSKVTDLSLRNCEVTVRSGQRFLNCKLRRISFQDCGLDDAMLSQLKTDGSTQIDIFNSKADSAPIVTLAGFVNWLPEGISTLRIDDESAQFSQGRHSYGWEYRLSSQDLKLSANIIDSLLEKGVQSVALWQKERCRQNIDLFATRNPAIALEIPNSPSLWPQLRTWTNLEELTISNAGDIAVTFDTTMKLKTLFVDGGKGFVLNRSLFNEVAKLKSLRWLQFRNQYSVSFKQPYVFLPSRSTNNKNRRTVSIDIIEPLRNHPSLETIIIDDLSDEASAFVNAITESRIAAKGNPTNNRPRQDSNGSVDNRRTQHLD